MTGNRLAITNGNGQMPCSDVICVCELMNCKAYDLVKTVRTKRDDGLYRMLISTVYNLFFKAMYPGIDAWDMNAKPKIMTRELYEKMKLESNGWFVDAEIMIKARRLKASMGEIETTFYSIDHRASFVKPLAILEIVVNMIRYRIKEFGAK